MKKATICRRSDCPISFALDLFGDKWTLLVLRDLVIKRKRHFQEFLASDEKIASNILAQRLRRLEAAGVLTRERDPASGRRVIYRPTEKGADLIPALLELVRWSAKYDAQTAAPKALVRRIAEDRAGVAAELRAALRKT